jgi:hypothetical protein
VHHRSATRPAIFSVFDTVGKKSVVVFTACRPYAANFYLAQADDLLSQARNLQRRASDILDKAEAVGELRTALSAIREARGNLELLAKISEKLDERPATNVLVSAEWVSVRTAMIEALGFHPEARVAVAERLKELEAE